MKEELYNHTELCSLIYCGNLEDSKKELQKKISVLATCSLNLKHRYLSSLNHSIYNYILIHENISLHDCCYDNDVALQSLTTATFERIGIQIIQSYLFCSDYIIQKYSNPYIQQALKYIHKNLSSPLRLDEISNQIGINKCYLCHLFCKEVKTSFSQYVLQQRIHLATRLLKNTSVPMDEIATLCGFQTVSYFNTSYKKVTGITPGSLRKQHKIHS